MMTRKPSELRLERLAAGLRIADVVAATGLAATRISEIERADGRAADDDEVRLIREAIAASRSSSEQRRAR